MTPLEAMVDELMQHGISDYSVLRKGAHPELVVEVEGVRHTCTFSTSPSDVNAHHEARRKLRRLLGWTNPQKAEAVAPLVVEAPVPPVVQPIEPPVTVADVASPSSVGPTADELNVAEIGQIVGHMVAITPAMAERWLTANVGNRSIRERHVITLRDDIVEGRWKITHQGIAFARSGRLLDGQHRLKAIIAADKAATLPVFVDLPDDVFGALDRGKMRSFHDLIDTDRRMIDACSFLAGLMLTGDRRAVAAAEVATMIGVFRDDFGALIEAGARNIPGRTPSPVRAAWILRHHSAKHAHKRLLQEQWAAFVDFDIKAMDTSTASLVRRLQPENLRSQTGGLAKERAEISWIGFNPKRRDLHRIQVNSDAQLQQMRELIMDALTSPTSATT